jgi:hypothetical protein
MAPNPLYAECIQRAAGLLGGYAALGARIGVPSRLLERWAQGHYGVTETVFLKVVDVLFELNAQVPRPDDPASRPPDPAPGGPGTPA